MSGLKPFKELPAYMKNKEVKKYYDILNKKTAYIKAKRAFDLWASSLLIAGFLLPMGIIAVMVKKYSKGDIFFKQVRVTAYGRKFKIYKFRTMYQDMSGSKVTVGGDKRITKVGGVLRKYRLDEIPQLFNIWKGDMSFVGTRPEVPGYVKRYRKEWYATLLLPAGLTSSASFKFRNEDKILQGICHKYKIKLQKEGRSATNITDEVYVREILKKKMKYNLIDIKEVSMKHDLKILFRTFINMFNF